MNRNYRISSRKRDALLVARAVLSLARPNLLLLGAGCVVGWVGSMIPFSGATAAHAHNSQNPKCGSVACLASYRAEKAEKQLRNLELERLAWRTEKGRYEAEMRNVRRLYAVKMAATRKDVPLGKWLRKADQVLRELRDTNHELKKTTRSSPVFTAHAGTAGVHLTASAHPQSRVSGSEQPIAGPIVRSVRSGVERALPAPGGDTGAGNR